MSGETIKIEFELPIELFFRSRSITQSLIKAEALLRLAATFYADGSLSLGKAAQLANVSKQDSMLQMDLDHGEAEAVVLAKELEADYLLLDEKKARRVARNSEIKLMGTVGILGLAAKKGLISNLDDAFNKLEYNSFRFTEEVKNKVKEDRNKYT